MRKRIFWSVGVGLVGLYLATADTYWLPGTLLSDLSALAFGIVGGGFAGYSIARVAESVADERTRRLKVLHWLFVMAVLGCFLGFGRGVPIRNTLTVLACTLSIGLAVGTLQYYFQPPKVTPRRED